MATDYDTPRKTDDDVDQDSLEELKARRSDKTASAVDVDEFDAAEGLELPGADLSNEELAVRVLPKQADEFTCMSCFLVHHRSQLAREKTAQPASPGSTPDDERGLTASLEAVRAADVPPGQEGHSGASGRLHGLRRGVARSRRGAVAAVGAVADRIIDIAPRVPVRDLATLRGQFPGLGPEELADKLVAGACNATATVGAGIGAAAMMPVPPAMLAELAAEITGVATVELKLVA